MFAAWYDQLNMIVEGFVKPYRDETAGRAHGEVLEIGGGTGGNLEYYSKQARVTVLEPNPHMSRRLAKNAIRTCRPINIVSGIGEMLPFPDETFDSVVSTLVLCMVKDVDAVVSETYRTLKPGGIFYFYEHVKSINSSGRICQNMLNPVWKFMTTGCNLNRDIALNVKLSGFRKVEIREFSLAIGLPVTIPNIVGKAVR